MACQGSVNAASKAACHSGVPSEASKAAAVTGVTERKKKVATTVVAGIGAVAVGAIAAKNTPMLGNAVLGVAVKQDKRAHHLYRQATDLVAQTLTNPGSNRLKSLKDAERLAEKSIRKFRNAGQAARVAAHLQGARASRLTEKMSSRQTAKGAIRARILLNMIRQTQARAASTLFATYR
jgi:hypothetical protein